jgi:uroporphyrin-III C-methyltransferase
MGLTKAGEIAERLIGAGREGSTPALIVERASLPDERRVLTTLSGLGAAAVGLTGPALLIVGEAMAMAQVEAPSTASRSHSPRGGGEALAFSPPVGGRPGEAGSGAVR